MTDNTLDLFSGKTESLLESMRAAHDLLEDFRSLSQELCDARQKLEGDSKLCACVSDALYYLADATNVISHNLATYAAVINRAAQLVVSHDAEKAKTEEAIKTASEFLGSVLSTVTEPVDDSNLN